VKAIADGSRRSGASLVGLGLSKLSDCSAGLVSIGCLTRGRLVGGMDLSGH